MCKGDNSRRKMSVHYIAVIYCYIITKKSSKENVIVHDYFTSLILLICDLKLQTSLILCYVAFHFDKYTCCINLALEHKLI